MSEKQYLLLNKQRKVMANCLSVGGTFLEVQSTWRAIPSVLNETVLSDQSFKSYQNRMGLFGNFDGNS